MRTADDAWRVVFVYLRRWQVETTWRYGKSALAMESPRVWTWERREKLLLMAPLVYAFLLSLRDPAMDEVRHWLLRCWCHRTGKRSREAPTALYRIRSALGSLNIASHHSLKLRDDSCFFRQAGTFGMRGSSFTQRHAIRYSSRHTTLAMTYTPTA